MDEEGRYFYKGKNVNNYVQFNNETWRIISIEPDKTIKIMRWDIIGNMQWDSSNSNSWARPASLNTYLNGTYLSSMTSTAQSQIASKEWSVGAVDRNDTSLSGSIADENSSKWNGKVALATVSEYIRSNSNQNSCGTHSKNQSNYSSCKNTTWMFNNDSWWTLSPYVGNSYIVFLVTSYSYFDDHGHASYTNGVRPAVYLSSEVQITGGSGTSSSPYTLG